MKVKKRFYVAAQHILTNDWAKTSLEDAIAHAKEILDSEPNRDMIAISQIIYVVKRETTPKTVIKVT